jgi:hypothetical protein
MTDAGALFAGDVRSVLSCAAGVVVSSSVIRAAGVNICAYKNTTFIDFGHVNIVHTGMQVVAYSHSPDIWQTYSKVSPLSRRARDGYLLRE